MNKLIKITLSLGLIWSQTSLSQTPVSDSGMCLAVRGNGQRIFAHFGAIANVLEDANLAEAGPVHAVIGGSSGSISSFFLQSVMLNPATQQCAHGPCTVAEQKKRQAFLFKTMEGLLHVAADSPELQALSFFATQIKSLKESSETAQEMNPEDLLAALPDLLGPAQLGSYLINPDLVDFVTERPEDIQWRLQQLQESLGVFGSFDASDPGIFYRPSLFNFENFARSLGRLASFYAGYDPVPQGAWANLLDSCAAETRGLLWAKFPLQCRAGFTSLLKAFLEAPAGPNRADDPMGKGVLAFVGTSATTAVEPYQQKVADYLHNHVRPFPIYDNADHLKFVYFTSQRGETAVQRTASHLSEQEQPRRYVSMTPASWVLPLTLSPAEPGLSPGIPFTNDDEDWISFGGWSNLIPLDVLQHVEGCRSTVFINRPGGNFYFASTIAQSLGMDPTAADRIYAIDQPQSAIRQAIDTTDYMVCSDWDGIALSGLDGYSQLVEDGFTAPVLSKENRQDPIYTPVPGCF